jgi:phenylacetic acid degradation operon negative regulatory protein
MGLPRSRPSDTLLDLLRGAGRHGRSARSLIAVAELFGLTDNAVRVTLSRLVARGVVESPKRGQYRLAAQANSLNEFVERWRLGETRVREWVPGEWLFAHLQGDPPGNVWALEALGFREVRSQLYVRPDNLALTLDDLHDLGSGIGLGSETLLVAGRPQGRSTRDRWHRAWHPKALNDGYIETIERLRSSAAHLNQLEPAAARLESFRIGGEAIHLLAKDPLLPAGFVDVQAREALWREMVAYETAGKRIWAGAFQEATHSMPIPQLAAGGWQPGGWQPAG